MKTGRAMVFTGVGNALEEQSFTLPFLKPGALADN